jgi:hypothetical protein
MILALENSPTDTRARVYREGLGTNQMKFTNVYLGDTISRGRTTVDVGVRYDRQWGAALQSNTKSNAAFSSLVPGIQFAGYESPAIWSNVSPRVGITYALDASHKTIVRGSYSRYAGQLENLIVGYSNPSSNAGYAEYPWKDLNGNHLAEANEVLLNGVCPNGNIASPSTPCAFSGGFNPAAPTSVVSADKIDPNLKAPVTQSAVFGVDRELVANLGLQINYSFTRTTDWYYEPWNGIGPADYLAGRLVSGTFPMFGGDYSVQTYNPDPAKVAARGNGRLISNYPGYSSRYHGVEMSLVKRLSNRWMGRIGAAWNNATENYDVAVDYFGNPTRRDVEPLVNGGAFVVRSSGSGAGDIFIHGKWQMNANGAYTFPRDVMVSGNLFGRQGYPFPVYRSVSLGLDGSQRVLMSPELDTFRLPNLWDLDLRLSKEFRFGRGRATAAADLFNVANANTALVRNRNAESTGQTGFYALSQNLSPRILRIGLEIGF